MKTLSSVINVLVPVVTAITAYLVYSLDASVKRFDNQLKAREATRLEAFDSRETRFKIYEAVTKSLEATDIQRQKVAQALVLAMLDTNDPLRQGLLEVFRTQGASETVKSDATVALEQTRQFATQEQVIKSADRAPTADWRGNNVDVFWCTASGLEAKSSAERVVASLNGAGAKGRIRVRELPPSINAAPGYQISGLVIRREAHEEAAAAGLKQAADQIYRPTGEFTVTESRQSTPGYMSMFVCPS